MAFQHVHIVACPAMFFFYIQACARIKTGGVEVRTKRKYKIKIYPSQSTKTSGRKMIRFRSLKKTQCTPLPVLHNWFLLLLLCLQNPVLLWLTQEGEVTREAEWRGEGGGILYTALTYIHITCQPIHYFHSNSQWSEELKLYQLSLIDFWTGFNP